MKRRTLAALSISTALAAVFSLGAPKVAAAPKMEIWQIHYFNIVGIPERDRPAAWYIIDKESSWRYNVWNAQGSKAYGLCQALPASKMATAGHDYMANPTTQLKWCDSYAKQRYGGWWKAKAFWEARRWW